jgi:3-oxoacyl-(acyl-carrier-protein) synthase
MISITGIGWINQHEYGCVMKGLQESYAGEALPRKKIFSYAFKNFGRLDSVSKMTCSAAALALKDAGIDCSPELKQDIGIVSANLSGCLETDTLYFKDYLDSGRTLARGNLFIYTLPSSPSGEAAIHFGLQGPLLYITAQGRPVMTALRTAAEIILGGESYAALAGLAEADYAIYFVLKGEGNRGGDVLCCYDDVMKVLEKDLSLKKMVEEFINSRKGSAVL